MPMSLAPTENPINPPENRVMRVETEWIQTDWQQGKKAVLFFPPHQLHTQQVIERLAGNPSLLPSVNPTVHLPVTAVLPPF